MRNRVKFGKILMVSLLVFCCLFGISASAKTAFSETNGIPFDSYTYWDTENGTKAVYTKPMFEVSDTLNAETLGVAPFGNIADISVDEQGNTYLLDSEKAVITVLNSDFRLKTQIDSVGGQSFKGAQGIYVRDGHIYIADTENARVLIADCGGRALRALTLPQSDIIPDDYSFRPIRLTADSDGDIYVLSEGSYYGALLFSEAGELLGFSGANTVSVGIAEAFFSFFEKLTMTNEKKAGQASKLPYTVTDLYVDSADFVYTVTGKTKEGELQRGAVKKLSPGGTNILPSDSVIFGEKEAASTDYPDFNIGAQNIAGIAVDEYGFFCVFDTTYSKLYFYDNECNMLCAFGGGFDSGTQKGTFQRISGIDMKGDDILVADSMKKSITVFRCTDYGKKLKALRKLTADGEYKQAEQGWKEIHKADADNRFAYIGLAKAALSDGRYTEAMRYAKSAYDRDTYSQAFRHVRAAFLKKHFLPLFSLQTVCIVGAVILLFRKKTERVKWGRIEWRLFRESLFHPVAAFNDIKRLKKGSVGIATGVLALYYISVITGQMFGSFVFVSGDNSSFNSLLVLLQTVGAVVLWSVANWGVCTLMGGIGKLTEIYTTVCYSLIPVIIGNFAYTAVTHVLIPSEAAFMSVITGALTLYTLFMIIVGTIIIHDFSFGKFVGSAILTLFGMAIVLLVGILFIILVQQLGAFLMTVFNELFYK